MGGSPRRAALRVEASHDFSKNNFTPVSPNSLSNLQKLTLARAADPAAAPAKL